MIQIVNLVAQRIALGLFTLLVVTLLIFLAVELLPGDFVDAILRQGRTPESVEALRSQIGLDQPAYLRYFSWLTHAAQGDFGYSFTNERPVSDLIGKRLYNTFFLAGYAAAMAVPVALTFGLLAALYRNSVFDRVINITALSAISSPEFLAAYILIFVFSVQLGWLPSLAHISAEASLWESLKILFLPAVTLTLVTVAHMMRMTRAAIINLMTSPYIEMALLKGIGPKRLIIRHALPNALSPIVNVVAMNLAYLVVGVVVVEVVFVYPGLGQLLVDSVSKRDMPVVQAGCLIFAVTYIGLNLMADILSIVTNPRLLNPS